MAKLDRRLALAAAETAIAPRLPRSAMVSMDAVVAHDGHERMAQFAGRPVLPEPCLLGDRLEDPTDGGVQWRARLAGKQGRGPSMPSRPPGAPLPGAYGASVAPRLPAWGSSSALKHNLDRRYDGDDIYHEYYISPKYHRIETFNDVHKDEHHHVHTFTGCHYSWHRHNHIDWDG